ncbi:MAG: ABC transporter substrate-binding protein, partial [Anaerolineae bacterium]
MNLTQPGPGRWGPFTVRSAILGPAACLVLAAACGAPPARGPTVVATAPGWQTAAADSFEPVPVTLGLPFRPDVQFTPLYVALDRGYFKAEGLDVTFSYGSESDFVRLVAANEMTAVIASGEQVLLARTQGLPVTYVATWYHRFPVAVFSLDPELHKPQDLVGHTVGLPDLSGASFLGWQAMLAAAGIDEADVQAEVVGYTQLDAVEQGRVDAAVGYAVNEPLELAARGHDVAVMEVADFFDLVANGLVVSESEARDSPGVVQGLVNGLLLGVEATLDDTEAAFDIAATVVPGLDD